MQCPFCFEWQPLGTRKERYYLGKHIRDTHKELYSDWRLGTQPRVTDLATILEVNQGLDE